MSSPDPPSRPARRARALVLLAAFVGGLGLCELGVRWFDLGPAPRPRVEASVRRPVDDPTLRFVNRADGLRVTRFVDRSGNTLRTVEQRTNTQRTRGPEVALPKPPGLRRIVCVGDSHTFGEGVADHETWPARLATELGDREPEGLGLEFVNAGVIGYDTAQESIWIREHVLTLEPDVVLLQYFVNDAAIEDTSSDSQALPVWLRWTHPQNPGWTGDLRRRSAAFDALCEGLFRTAHLRAFGRTRAASILADGPGWTRSLEHLRTIRDDLRAANVDLAVLLFPMLVTDTDGQGLITDAAFERVTEALARATIPCLDASPAFTGLDLAPLRLAPGDLHAGAGGYEVFARWAAEQPSLLAAVLPSDD